MRILVNASFLSGKRVGIATYLRNVIPRLAERHEVHVLTSSPEELSGAPISTIEVPTWTRSVRGRFVWERTGLGLHCTHRYDVLFNPTPLGLPGSRIPLVSVVHDLTPLVLRREHTPRYKMGFWLSLQSLRWADAVITDSWHTRRDLLKHRIVPEHRVSVGYLGPGVNTDSPDDTLARQLSPFVLYVGGHIPNKNVGRLVAAFSMVRSQAELRLVIVGWGTDRQVEATRRAVKRYGLDDRVVLLSGIGDRQLSGLYRHCQAFVSASLYEGFGLPVLEAMAHEAPVACSDTSSLREIAGDAALFFRPDSTGEISGALERILTSEPLARDLKSRGKARSAAFTWNRCVTAIEQAAERAHSHWVKRS